jgi:hypothetical protein
MLPVFAGQFIRLRQHPTVQDGPVELASDRIVFPPLSITDEHDKVLDFEMKTPFNHLIQDEPTGQTYVQHRQPAQSIGIRK